MPALAGHKLQLYARSDTTAPTLGTDEVAGSNEFSVDISKDIAETTDFKDSSGAKLRMALLEDAAAALSGDWYSTDAVQQLIRTNFDAGTTIYVTVYFDPSAAGGSKGYRVPVLASKWTAKGQVAGKCEWNVSFVGNGIKVAV